MASVACWDTLAGKLNSSVDNYSSKVHHPTARQLHHLDNNAEQKLSWSLDDGSIC